VRNDLKVYFQPLRNYSQMELWAKDPSIGGGAFSVRRDSTTPAMQLANKEKPSVLHVPLWANLSLNN
jgi:hypothetical protein